MILTRSLFGQPCEVVACTLEDVEPNFDKIKKVVSKQEMPEFKRRMVEAVEKGSAFMISDGSCFLYYLNDKPWCATGVALYGKNSPIKMLALFYSIFTDIDTHTFKMSFYLHPKKLAQEYKSIVTMASIKQQILPNYPLVARIDEFKKKINKLHEKRNRVWVS